MSFMSLITHNEFVAISVDLSEGRTPPVPGAVDDNVGGVGDERRVVSVEFARLVRRTSTIPAWTDESTVC